MALMERREDDGRERICKLVVNCPNGHGPYWRWADREDDPFVADATWAPRFAERSGSN
jgi:hypothetical protein